MIFFLSENVSQWGREFRALCDLGELLIAAIFLGLSQWGREFRALCDGPRPVRSHSRRPRLNGAANSARSVTATEDDLIALAQDVSMGPRIPRAL